MALVVLPEGQQRSGSIGGTVWSHNRSGAYVRNRSVPVNPNTDRQAAVRLAVRNLAIEWEEILTQAQRNAWDTYAANVDWKNRLGQSINLTGLNHFIRSNAIRGQAGVPTNNVAPSLFLLALAEDELAVAASEATQELTINGNAAGAWLGIADSWQFFFMGLPQNAGIKFFGGPYRLITAIPGSGPPPFPAVVAAPFPFAEGQRIWVRSRISLGDGRLSDFAQVDFLGAA